MMPDQPQPQGQTPPTPPASPSPSPTAPSPTDSPAPSPSSPPQATQARSRCPTCNGRKVVAWATEDVPCAMCHGRGVV